MLYAIIILSILVVILLLCIGVLLYGMKNNKKTLDGILGNDDVTEEEIISMVREGHEPVSYTHLTLPTNSRV